MNTNTATVAVKPSLPLLNDVQERSVIQAFNILFSVLSTHGSTKLPTSFDMCDASDYDVLASRAVKSINALASARREARIAQFRSGCKAIVAEYMVTAHAARSEYDSMSPTLKAIVRLPETVSVPVASFADALQGVKETDMVKVLRDLGYTIAKSKDGSHNVSLPFPKGDSK